MIMAFNNGNKNSRNRVNTNTRLIQMYNETAGEDSGTMSLGFWNNYASININPMLPKSEQIDGKIYNYEKTASTLLNIDNITQLYTGIKLLEKAEKAKSEKIMSVATKSNNVIAKIGRGGEYDGIDSYYLALFSLNDNDQVDGNAFYIFTSPLDGLLINYNEDDGSFKNKSINTQWEQFKAFIEYSMKVLINGGSHGSNKEIDIELNKIGNIVETTKSLVENILNNGGGSSSSSDGMNRQSNRSGFAGSRRRRSSLSIENINVDDDEDDGLSKYVDVPDDADEEEGIIFNEEEEVKPARKSTKKSSSAKKTTGKKASAKKSSKKISVEDIAADMDDELDDMDDLD